MKGFLSLAYLASVLFLSWNSCPSASYFAQEKGASCCSQMEEGRDCPLSNEKGEKSFVCCDEARVGTLSSAPDLGDVSLVLVGLINTTTEPSQDLGWETIRFISDPDPPGTVAFLSPPTRAPPRLAA